jgi:hypothetical protein
MAKKKVNCGKKQGLRLQCVWNLVHAEVLLDGCCTPGFWVCFFWVPNKEEEWSNADAVDWSMQVYFSHRSSAFLVTSHCKNAIKLIIPRINA